MVGSKMICVAVSLHDASVVAVACVGVAWDDLFNDINGYFEIFGIFSGTYRPGSKDEVALLFTVADDVEAG
jgi:hypothetical protein